MSRVVRLALACLVLALVSATAASGQTFKLSVVIEGNTPGVVRAVTGAAGACAQAECVFYVDAGATVRLAAVGGRGPFSQGTGPAKGCGASICSFVMTAAADVIATFTSGDGPIATLTIDSAGDEPGLVVVDGVTCAGRALRRRLPAGLGGGPHRHGRGSRFVVHRVFGFERNHLGLRCRPPRCATSR